MVKSIKKQSEVTVPWGRIGGYFILLMARINEARACKGTAAAGKNTRRLRAAPSLKKRVG
jgi:hypothetical protein